MSECGVAEMDEEDDNHLAGVLMTEHIYCTPWTALRSFAVSYFLLDFLLLPIDLVRKSCISQSSAWAYWPTLSLPRATPFHRL